MQLLRQRIDIYMIPALEVLTDVYIDTGTLGETWMSGRNMSRNRDTRARILSHRHRRDKPHRGDRTDRSPI